MVSWSKLSSLPEDLLRSIFRKTPTHALVWSTTICKKFASIINNKSFVYDHFKGSPEQFIRISSCDCVIADPETSAVSSTPIPEGFLGGANKLRYAFDCDGLLLCYFNSVTSGESSAAVWNPLLRRVKWIPPATFSTTSDLLGLGYTTNSNTGKRQYKMIRWSDYTDGSEVEIADLSSVSWRVLRDTEIQWEIDEASRGIGVQGHSFWVATKEEKVILVKFDFTTESFQTEDLNFLEESDYKLLTCFGDNQLGLLKQGEVVSREMEVWISSNVNEYLFTFTKFFSVNHMDLPELHSFMTHPVCLIGKDKHVFVWCEREEIEDHGSFYTCTTLYDIGENGVRKETETERVVEAVQGPYLCGYVYRRSLVWCI